MGSIRNIQSHWFSDILIARCYIYCLKICKYNNKRIFERVFQKDILISKHLMYSKEDFHKKSTSYTTVKMYIIYVLKLCSAFTTNYFMLVLKSS